MKLITIEEWLTTDFPAAYEGYLHALRSAGHREPWLSYTFLKRAIELVHHHENGTIDGPSPLVDKIRDLVGSWFCSKLSGVLQAKHAEGEHTDVTATTYTVPLKHDGQDMELLRSFTFYEVPKALKGQLFNMFGSWVINEAQRISRYNRKFEALEEEATMNLPTPAPQDPAVVLERIALAARAERKVQLWSMWRLDYITSADVMAELGISYSTLKRLHTKMTARFGSVS